MHELSIVMSIIGIAESQATLANASRIDEIELDIGTLSGIEFDALDFAWTEAVRKTILENAVRKINRIDAMANCSECGNNFSIQHFYDACPLCGGHLINITRGKELRVRSLLVS